jgi:hypothetical protein
VNDQDLIARFAAACDEATADITAPPATRTVPTRTRWTTPGWVPPAASALLVAAAALGAFVIQQHVLQAHPDRPAASRFGGVCAGAYTDPAPPGAAVTTRFRVGDLLVGPAISAPFPDETTLRARFAAWGTQLDPGSQVRYGHVIEPAVSPQGKDSWLITSCGHPLHPMRPTQEDPSPQDRIYQTATYGLLDDNGRPTQVFTVDLDEPQCPHRVGPAGGPAAARAAHDGFVSGDVIGGVFCRYYSNLHGSGQAEPGAQHGAAGMPAELARQIAAALNDLPVSSAHLRPPSSCPADLGVVDVLMFYTSQGAQEVWAAPTGCRHVWTAARASGAGDLSRYDELTSTLVLPPLQ